MSDTTNENESNSNGNKESGNGKASTSESEDRNDLHEISDQRSESGRSESGRSESGRSESGRRLATFSLSMSDCEYASDDARSNASTLDQEDDDDEEEPKESDRRMWMRQRELRLSLILGISADERCEKQLAMRQDDDDGDSFPDFNRLDIRPAETSQDDRNSRALETKGESSQLNTTYHEDREFDFLRSANMRRCSSLKTNKTPPGTPHRKKAVRFADVLGLDLASVRHIINLDEPPIVPPSAMQDLDLHDRRDDRHPILVQVRHLCTCFSQPGCSPDFIRRVQERKVSLETCVVEDKDVTVSGLIRVANIAYHKSVIVRHTVNGWMTYTDDAAAYVSGSSDGATDRFSFTIHLPEYFGFGSRLEFSVMFSTGDQQFWDSNFGSNYRVECYFNMEPYSESEQSAANRFY